MLSNETIAIVGARNSSINSRIFTKRISKELVSEEYITVSGIARGWIKSSSRRAIVVALGYCVYPPKNKKLYETDCGSKAYDNRT